MGRAVLCAFYGGGDGPVLRLGLRPVCAVAAAFAMTACSAAAPQASATPPASRAVPTTTGDVLPSQSPSATPDAEAKASAAALSAYRGFRAAQVVAGRTSDAHSPGLAKYAGDKALADERASLLQLERAGIVFVGEPGLSPQVSEVDLGAYPSVTILDCVDNSHWSPVYEKTGKSAAAPGQPNRVLATAIAHPYAGGWIITSVVSDRSRTC